MVVLTALVTVFVRGKARRLQQFVHRIGIGIHGLPPFSMGGHQSQEQFTNGSRGLCRLFSFQRFGFRILTRQGMASGS